MTDQNPQPYGPLYNPRYNAEEVERLNKITHLFRTKQITLDQAIEMGKGMGREAREQQRKVKQTLSFINEEGLF